MADVDIKSHARSMFKTMLETSPSKRNKRKSVEPIKRFQMESNVQDFKRVKLEHSDGEDHQSSLSPGSSGSSDHCRSPSPFSLAPKKRFKIDALKDLHHQEQSDQKKSPFRPWDDNNKSPRSR